VLARTGTGMDGRQVMVTPHDVADGLPSSLMVARTVAIPVASRVLVQVCNTSDQPFSIRANQPVAEAKKVEVLEDTATVDGDDKLPEHLLELWHSACEQGELDDQLLNNLSRCLRSTVSCLLATMSTWAGQRWFNTILIPARLHQLDSHLVAC
jgi:hypothetical protein